MSYLKKIEYEIVLEDSFSVIRGCSKCGRKTHFINTKKFRVNANRNKLEEQIVVTIHNPYQLKIHLEKQIAEALGLSRSQVKKLVELGKIKLEKNF